MLPALWRAGLAAILYEVVEKTFDDGLRRAVFDDSFYIYS